MAFFPETGPENDEDRHEVLKNRGGRRIAVSDGSEITVLGPQHAQGPENEEGQPVLPVLPDGPYIFLEEICRQDEDQSRNEEPEKSEPFRRHSLSLEKNLPRNPAGPPERGPDGCGKNASPPFSRHGIASFV